MSEKLKNKHKNKKNKTKTKISKPINNKKNRNIFQRLLIKLSVLLIVRISQKGNPPKENFRKYYEENEAKPFKNKYNIPLEHKSGTNIQALKETWYYLLNIVAALASILGCLQITVTTKELIKNFYKFIFQLFKFSYDFNNNFDKLYVITLRISFSVLTLVIFLCIFISVRATIYKYNVLISNFATGFHSINKSLKNSYFSRWKKYSENFITIDGKEYCKEKEDRIFDIGYSSYNQIARIIQTTLKKLTGVDISVCIKIIDVDVKKDNIIDQSLRTMCRSSDDILKRERIDEYMPLVSIKENFDFSMIVTQTFKDDYFAIADLDKFSKKTSIYFNSNEDWSDLYSASIVLPIGMSKKEGFDTLGFLCVDSKNKKVFKGTQGTIILNYLAGIADNLYIHLEKSIHYYTKAKILEKKV